MSLRKRLIVGLGNPGVNYDNTRHNIGFYFIDLVAEHFGADKFKNKFDSHFSSISHGSSKIILLKPQTYMNNSGIAVKKALSYNNINMEDVLVIHDDIDLPLGKLKVKRSGGHAGHNGLKSIDAHITSDYLRIRVGIGRPQDKSLVANYVLNNFSKAEFSIISQLTAGFLQLIDNFVENNNWVKL